jgi:predicted transcriptional regulator of viral defense system
MDKKTVSILTKLSKLKSFTLSDVRRLGLSHTSLYKLVKEEKIIKLTRGIYAVNGFESVGHEADYEIANKKFSGQSVIGGLTALSHYKLIDEVPSKIWLLVPPIVRTTDKKYRLIRTSKNLSIGVENYSGYKIVSLERALLDALVCITKIGERTSKLAIIRALRSRMTTEAKIFEMAKKLKVLKVLDRHWQSILAGLEK